MRPLLLSPSVERDMHELSVPAMAMPGDGRPTQLERARRRRDQAAQGSPDWDAASEAVLELEATDAPLQTEQPRPRLFLLEPSSVR
jgi:hypothetical protein